MTSSIQKTRARSKVNAAARAGRLPHISTCSCVECGAPAQQYDHAHGYDDEHALDVEPVCNGCNGRRRSERGELPRGDAHHTRRLRHLRPRGAALQKKLSEEDVREIRRLVATGHAQAKVAQQYGVSQMNISKIVRRVTWAHVAT